MPFCEMRYFSQSIEKQDNLQVVLPDGEGPFPVLYLLHGLSDDCTMWLRQTRLERYASGRRMIIVMPDTHRFWYVNDPRPGGLRYEDHIVHDVVGTVERTFHAVRNPNGRAVAGLSMGGYGAVMLALRHPRIFSAAVSHSGALGFARAGKTFDRSDLDSMAAALQGQGYDLFELARQRAEERLPALRLDCGTEDGLIEHNREFHGLLQDLGVKHEYEEFPGGHDWDYWDAHVPQTLDFIQRHFDTVS
jgi:S-formylglutathione hydrolase FrmB